MRVLIIVPPDREDFYGYLKRDTRNEYHLLWYEKRKANLAPAPPFFKSSFFWEEYATPQRLLDATRPDKVVFFEIIDQRQIALLVAANGRGITTIYLEHGAAADRDTALERARADMKFVKKRIGYVANRLLLSSWSILKTKWFYFSAFGAVKSLASKVKFIRLPFQMQWTTPNKALIRISFPERTPRYALTFNENNFNEYHLYTHAPAESAIFTGVPMYDAYAAPVQETENNEVVYIEHPYLEQHTLAWDEAHHRRIARLLAEGAAKAKTKILVKLHPRSNKALWDSYDFLAPHVEVVQQGDYTRRYLQAKLILGYSSSLITGLLCAKKNIVLLGWHPTPRIFCADFSATGLCHKSLDPNDIFTKMDVWQNTNLTITEPALHSNFLHKFNYPFDGNAAERVMELIHTL